MKKGTALWVACLAAGIGLFSGCSLDFQSTSGSPRVATDPPYDFYPGTGYYPSGSTEDYQWQTPSGIGLEDFESYVDGSVIETSSNKAMQSHLEVTSGTLVSKYLSQGVYRRAKTETYNFRMLIQGLADGLRVKWRDQAMSVRCYVDSWQDTDEAWQGVHLFTRYRTEDNLYVVSLRKDGTVFIKKVQDNVYTTLAEGPFKDQNGTPRTFNTKQWYKLTVATIGNQLSLYVDNVLQLQVTSGTFSWGTLGIRTDYANVYLDDLKVYTDLTDFR